MPADKDAAKRRRQARNRQERQNRQARTEGAKRAASRPSRTPEDTPARSGSKGAKTNLAKTPARAEAPAPGGFLGKLFPPRPQPEAGTDGRPSRTARPPRAPSAVVDVDEVPGPRGILMRLTAQPGGRAAVLALLVAVISGATLFVAPVAPPPVLEQYGAMVALQAEGGDPRDAAAVEDLQEDYVDEPVVAEYSVGLLDLVPPAAAAVYALVPVLIAGMAVRALTRGTRTRTLMICAVTGVLYVVMLGPIGIFFFLGVLALGFAAYQSAKADKAALAAAA